MVGVSGAGKTMMAVALADRLGVPVLELDGLFHQPGWTRLGAEEFTARVRSATDADGWVVDGNYSATRDLVWDRADTVVFLDLPRWRVMAQLSVRTLRRMWTGRELWNGNRESWSNLLSREAERNILLWSWTTHGGKRRLYRELMGDPRWPHLRFIPIRSRRQGAQLLASLPGRR